MEKVKEKTLRVKFLREQIYEIEGRNKGPKYLAGSVHDLPEAQAMRWINREVAFETDENVSPENYKAPAGAIEVPAPGEQITRPRQGPDATTSADVFGKKAK